MHLLRNDKNIVLYSHTTIIITPNKINDNSLIILKMSYIFFQTKIQQRTVYTLHLIFMPLKSLLM